MPFKIDYLQSALRNWQHVENQEREGTPTPLLHKTSGNCRSNCRNLLLNKGRYTIRALQSSISTRISAL